jgi:protein-tyrosine phosphatase
VTRICERLYLGSLADSERLVDSNLHGITTVISLSHSPVPSERDDVLYVHIPIDEAKSIPVGRFDAVIDAIAENIRWGTVLVSCDEDESGAPTFTAAWMAAVGYKNIDAALAEIKDLQPFINPSKTFLNSLKEHLL